MIVFYTNPLHMYLCRVNSVSYLVDFLVMSFLQLGLGAHEPRMLADSVLP